MQVDSTGTSQMIAEERDLGKLKLYEIKNAIAIPISRG